MFTLNFIYKIKILVKISNLIGIVIFKYFKVNYKYLRKLLCQCHNQKCHHLHLYSVFDDFQKLSFFLKFQTVIWYHILNIFN